MNRNQYIKRDIYLDKLLALIVPRLGDDGFKFRTSTSRCDLCLTESDVPERIVTVDYKGNIIKD